MTVILKFEILDIDKKYVFDRSNGEYSSVSNYLNLDDLRKIVEMTKFLPDNAPVKHDRYSAEYCFDTDLVFVDIPLCQLCKEELSTAEAKTSKICQDCESELTDEEKERAKEFSNTKVGDVVL